MLRASYISLFGILIATIACQKHAVDQDADNHNAREVVAFPIQSPDSQVVAINQVNRKLLSQEIVVPTDQIYTDTFKQQEVLPPVIDILIVIDNSYSMLEEQQNLADKLSALISDLSEVDWQINVITTDDTCRRLPELPLKPDTPDMEELFQKAVNAGINGSASEVALVNSVDHLRKTCRTDPPWKREGTDLAVLIVSDEDEDPDSRYHEKPEIFFQDMSALGYLPGQNLKVYGLIGHPDEPCPTVDAPAITYADVIKDSDGLWGSICAPDYSPTLAAISRDIRLNLKIDFPLRFAPVLSTVKLELDGSVYSGDWTIVGQTLILAESLPEGSTLTVNYQVESFRLLQLSVGSEDYILNSISIEGELVDPTSYNYDQVSNTVLLMFDPVPGSIIETELIENQPLLTQFPFPSVTPKIISCFIDNVLMESEIKVDRGTLTISPTVPAGKTAHCLFSI